MRFDGGSLWWMFPGGLQASRERLPPSSSEPLLQSPADESAWSLNRRWLSVQSLEPLIGLPECSDKSAKQGRA